MDVSTAVNLVLVVIVVWFVYRRFAPVKGLRNLNGQAFEAELKIRGEKIVIDVREPYEYQSGSIPDAVNIPLSQIAGQVRDIPRDLPVYLYCRSGMRSKQAARVLSGEGYANLAHLQGGLGAWHGPVKRS